MSVVTLSTENLTHRGIKQVINGAQTSDGAGVKLRRYIATSEVPQMDPFLLLDVFHSDNPDDYIAGFPPHPHRGFETVTYLLDGVIKHRDSAGHEGIIKPGGVQWMTAGRGIEHSEIPQQEDGLLYGFQLWVNLPASKKMSKPRYQEFDAAQIPLEHRDDGTIVKVIAGNTQQGTQGIITDIAANPTFFDVYLPKDNRFNETINSKHNAFLFVISGQLTIFDNESKFDNESSTVVKENDMAILTDGEQISLKAEDDSQFLLIAGQPLEEPIARHGPFVMNHQHEIQQAYNDYQQGLFGTISD